MKVIIIYGFLICGILPFVLLTRPYGPFYVINEGFVPRTEDNHLIHYVTELKSDKDDWQDKTINGWFHVKRKIIDMKFSLQPYKKSGTVWIPRGQPLDFPDLCKVSVSGKHFWTCFTGTLNPKPSCTLDAGNYTLTNYSVEPDLRASVGKNMFYGDFKFSVTLKGITNDHLETQEHLSLTFNMTISINDLEHKAANAKAGAAKEKNAQSNKSNQTKSKSDNSHKKKN